MKSQSSIVKVYSIVFLLLTVFSLLGNNVHSFVKKEDIKKKELINQSDNSQTNPTQDESEQLIEKPFHAVVNAGLQWDFAKNLYVLPAIFEFFVPEQIKLTLHQQVTPLAYFVTLFYTSICVHAP
ncbi:MAG: hypothetical protein MUE81_05160 [Thermoflexibacter sp.]|jgi:hypothetical protein|nr:hypothetical protein [Thermoflexibacter sp.]